MTDQRRQLPSVGSLLESTAIAPLFERAGRATVVQAVRDAVNDVRGGDSGVPADADAWAALAGAALGERLRPSLRPLINGTGVVLHTNLGRAPLARAALDAVREVAEGFCNLEYDLEEGGRGSRHAHCVHLLRELTGAEDALVVNNCAAALVLALNTLSSGRDAIVSRGELVEIGGNFRVPDIMRRSGARLTEVGTTNRTHAADYAGAFTDRTAAIVKVHRSNFTMDGFAVDVPLSALAELAAARGVALIYDFGSGLMLPLHEYGLTGEVTARDTVSAAGTAIVLMSGDKLLGGPQAGIILGSTVTLERLRANPLARALRVDKLTLAALEATLAIYREPAVALREIPALAMLTAPADEIRNRAERLRVELDAAGMGVTVVPATATVGGGAFPTARIPSFALAFHGEAAPIEKLARSGDPPVIGRIADGRFLVDVRSIPARFDERVGAALARLVR